MDTRWKFTSRDAESSRNMRYFILFACSRIENDKSLLFLLEGFDFIYCKVRCGFCYSDLFAIIFTRDVGAVVDSIACLLV